MNEIVVGVKRIAHSTLAAPGEEANAAVSCLWATIDGKEIPSEYVISAEVVVDNGPLVVQLRIGASAFRTTDCYGPEAPQRFQDKWTEMNKPKGERDE